MGYFVKILGLDIGEKRIGIALSDEMGWTAQGIEVLERKCLEVDLMKIKELVESAKVSSVVMGLPKNMDGSLGESAQRIMSFARKFEEIISIPIIFWDERWTTKEATRLLIETDLGRKKRRKVVDKLAAVLILQGYLDSLTSTEGSKEE